MEGFKLGDVCDFQGGSQPPKSTFSSICKENYIRLIQIRDYKSENYIVFIPKDKARRLCTKEDVMIGRYGPPVFQILRGIDGAYNVALMKAVPDESRLSKDFLFHFLRTPKIQQYIINLSARASGQTGLNKAAIEPYLISFPSLSEQKRIVAIVDQAFEAIDGAIEDTKQNLANARELFESYLNDMFDWKGDRWEDRKIEDVCESIIDCINKTASVIDEPSPFKMIRTTNVRNGFINLDTVRYVTQETYQQWTRRQITKKGDILLTREAPMGEVGMLATEEYAFLGQRIVSYRTDSKELNNKFLLYAFQSNNLQSQIKAFASGSTVQHMRVPETKVLQVPIPSLSVQK